MTQPTLNITGKEVFYTALMLGSERLVGIEYDFPMDEPTLVQGLKEAKRSLHKRKLLRETSKGEVKLADELTAVAAFCAQPDECVVVDEPALKGVIYKVGVSSLLLEPLTDRDGEQSAAGGIQSATGGEYGAYLFTSEEALQTYLDSRMQAGDEAAATQAEASGGEEREDG